MRHTTLTPLALCASAVAAVANTRQPAERPSVLPPAITQPDTPAWKTVAGEPERHRLQLVIRTPVEVAGQLTFDRWAFRHGAEYFYPASTIKLFAAIAAVERFNDLAERHGAEWPLTTTLRWHDGPDSAHGAATTTLERETRKLFVVSDNPAYNRCYEFAGRTHINQRVRAIGCHSTRIAHRLSVGRTAEQNRRTPRVEIVEDEDVVAAAPAQRCDLTLTNEGVPGLRVGSARIAGGARLEEPLDFTGFNATSLDDLQTTLIALTEPASDAHAALRLSRTQRARLVEAATILPCQSPDPIYNSVSYPDGYVKFLLPGLLRVRPLDEWRITNKVGLAYGFVTENARVEHVPTGRRLFVAATLYTNPNETLNDGVYAYDDLALPFLSDLGESVGRALVALEEPAPPK
ncbi:MAG: serine hydrolase [Planctomycetota bacterium]